MKKTLKLLLIFMGVVLTAVVGGLSGYYLITKNKTWYIYDVRIVEPHPLGNSYVYTAQDVEFETMRNKRVYMTTYDENKFEIAVYLSTSTNTKNVSIYSSDTTIAKIEYQGGKCYVRYLKAGTAIITSEIGGVTDTFKLEVFDQVAEDFSVYDNFYYGDYAKYYSNKIIGYSDGIEYKYDYSVISKAGETADDYVDKDLLRIDESTVDYDLFESVELDPVNQTLNVKCKSGIAVSKNTSFVVQSYYRTSSDKISVNKNFIVNVRIVTHDPEFLQIELATTPNFEDAFIFMNTSVISSELLTEEVLKQDDELIDEYLAYKKAESYLEANEENPVYKLLFTDKVKKIYIKFRKIYTNGDVVYLNDLNNSGDNAFSVVCKDQTKIKVAPTGDFYELSIDKNYFDTNGKFTINFSLDNFDLQHLFEIEYASLTQNNIDLFYDFDETTGIYSYKYWDARSYFNNEVYDENGNVVGFKW